MNAHRSSLSLLVATAALLLTADGAFSQSTSVDRSFEPSPKDCADVRWSEAALQAFPSITSACQGIEQRNGKSYVKLEGVVESVEDRGKRIRVDFDDGEDLTFTPAPQTALYLDGKRTQFSEVSDGMHLNFYVPEDRLQAELQPDPNRVAFIIYPFDISIAPPDTRDTMTARTELPATASLWPTLGAAGIACLVLAIALTLRRNRHR